MRLRLQRNLSTCLPGLTSLRSSKSVVCRPQFKCLLSTTPPRQQRDRDDGGDNRGGPFPGHQRFSSGSRTYQGAGAPLLGGGGYRDNAPGRLTPSPSASYPPPSPSGMGPPPSLGRRNAGDQNQAIYNVRTTVGSTTNPIPSTSYVPRGSHTSPTTTGAAAASPPTRGASLSNVVSTSIPTLSSTGTTLSGAPSADLPNPEEVYRMQRRFPIGTLVTPKHFSFESQRNARRRLPRSRDVFDFLGLDPLTEYKNFNLLSEFTSDMGRIKHRTETGLRGVNQRKVAKAIRRAVGIGLLPSTCKHPEILKKMEENVEMRMRQVRTGKTF